MPEQTNPPIETPEPLPDPDPFVNEVLGRLVARLEQRVDELTVLVAGHGEHILRLTGGGPPVEEPIGGNPPMDAVRQALTDRLKEAETLGNDAAADNLRRRLENLPR